MKLSFGVSQIIVASALAVMVAGCQYPGGGPTPGPGMVYGAPTDLRPVGPIGPPPVGEIGSARIPNADGIDQHGCMGGYQWYPDQNACIKSTRHPHFVERAKCTPGETRRVDDPSKPGFFRIQTCGFVTPQDEQH